MNIVKLAHHQTQFQYHVLIRAKVRRYVFYIYIYFLQISNPLHYQTQILYTQRYLLNYKALAYTYEIQLKYPKYNMTNTDDV